MKALIALLWLVLLLFAVACDSGEAGTTSSPATAVRNVLIATPIPTETPSPTPTPFIPTPAPTLAAPAPTSRLSPPTASSASLSLAISPPQVGQGETALITIRGAAGLAQASATALGRLYPLVKEGDVFWGVVGVDAAQRPGEYFLVVSMTSQSGQRLPDLTSSLTVTLTNFQIDYVDLAPEQSALLAPNLVQQEQTTLDLVYATFTPARLWQGPFLTPLKGPITTYFGSGRSYNGAPATDQHHGTDFAADEGTPVPAAARGRVVFSAELPVRGNAVIIDHGLGVFTLYSHLSQWSVAEGQIVEKGQTIGLVGQTGLATGPHLHWEVVTRGVSVNGLTWTQNDFTP